MTYDAGFSPANSPHLLPALELDDAIIKFSGSLKSLGLPSVVRSVLAPNVARNCIGRDVQVCALDWTASADECHSTINQKTYDLIITADTVYSTSLIDPLLATIVRLALPSTPLLVFLERRDPALVDRMLATASDTYNFSVRRISHRKLAKALLHSGFNWARDAWDGIELWKLSLAHRAT